MYVSGCFGQVMSLLPENVQQQCYIYCSGTAVVQPAAATTSASTHNATQEPVKAQPLSPLKPDEQQGKEKLPDLRHFYVALRVLAYGAWRLTDSTEHPRQILLECVADGVPIGHCDASLTPNVVSEAVASLPDIAKLLALMPIGYVQHLTGVDANNQRLLVDTEPVANLADATWLSLPASSSGRSSFPLYIVSVSSEPSLAKTLVQSLGRNLTRGAKIRLRLAGLLVIQNDTPLLVEHFDGQIGHAYHPNRGGVRLRSEEITHLLPFITAVLLCNADTIGLECLQSRRKLRLRHVVRGPTRPHGIISFFDGSGSFANTLAEELGPPCAMLIAELDSSIRTVISAVQGYHLDPATWTYANHRIPVRYLADVWEIVHHHFAALREFLALLPEDALIIFGAGSPCQDNTKIGRGCGKLGITGTRSVHYHVVYIVMYALQEMGLAHRVVPMLENAGSMANCFKQYIQDTCGVPSSCIHRINTAEWSAVSRNRYFFVSPISCPRGKPTLGNKDGCCLNLGASRFRHLCPPGCEREGSRRVGT